jgi:hypothetical protein
MPDFKCVACRTRARHAEDIDGERCPSCGSPLERVGKLTEVVGFQSITTTEHPVDDSASLGDFTARRNAMYAERVRDAVDAARWTDDGGFAVAAVALPTLDQARATHRITTLRGS